MTHIRSRQWDEDIPTSCVVSWRHIAAAWRLMLCYSSDVGLITIFYVEKVKWTSAPSDSSHVCTGVNFIYPRLHGGAHWKYCFTEAVYPLLDSCFLIAEIEFSPSYALKCVAWCLVNHFSSSGLFFWWSGCTGHSWIVSSRDKYTSASDGQPGLFTFDIGPSPCIGTLGSRSSAISQSAGDMSPVLMAPMTWASELGNVEKMVNRC